MIRITKGDSYPTITVNVTENGNIVDLTGASAIFSMVHSVTGNMYQETCTITGNVISFKFTASSTVETGVYKGNFIVDFNNVDEDMISIPNDEYISVVVKAPTSTVGATGEYSDTYMKTEDYDVDVDGIVDVSSKLDDGATGKSYSDISLEIDTDITTHAAIATAHHTNVNDPTTNQKAALDAATSPSSGNKFITQNDTAVFGNMFKTTYDTNNNGVVDAAEVAPWSGISGKPSTYPATAHTHPTTDVTSLAEYIHDTIASTIVAGSQLSATYDDNAGTVTIAYQSTPLNEEVVQDIVGAMVLSGTGITVSYNDVAGTTTITLSAHAHAISDVTGLQTALNLKLEAAALANYFNVSTQTLDNITTGVTNVHFLSAEKTKLTGISTGADVTPADVFRKTIDDLEDIAETTNTKRYTLAEQTKLSGIATSANNYSLPTAAAGVLGGVKVGGRLSIANGVLSADIQSGAGDMMASLYDTGSANTAKSVDTADRLLYNSITKTYADIAAEIDGDITTHTNSTSAHHTRYTNTEAIDAAKGDSAIADALTKRHAHTNSAILAGITNVGSGLIISIAERSKLEGITSGANLYTLPTAASDVLGGVKVGAKLSIANGVLNAGTDVMLASLYDTGSTNTAYVSDTANALLDGGGVKTYANIAGKIDGDLSAHTNSTSAHHTRYTNAEAISAAKGDGDVADAITKKHAHTNSVVLAGITNAGSGLVITDAERTKLTNITAGANLYTLPTAAAGVLGGIKVGTGLVITDGVLSSTALGTGDMLIANYDRGISNTDYAVDTADALKNGASAPKTYANIALEIDGDITTHAGSATVHHTNVNDPSSDQKYALAGTNGTPSDSNRYVTNSDTRMTNARTPSTHTHPVAELTDITTTYEPIISSKGTAFNCSFSATSDAGYVCEANDARLANNRTPSAHATSHKTSGSDSIKLDELAAPDDVETLNATNLKHGLLKKLDGTTTNFLRGDGTWADPSEAVVMESFTRWEEGDISTSTSFMPHLITDIKTITSVRGYIQVLPVGQSIQIDVRKNDPLSTTASIFTVDAPGEIATNLVSTNGVYQYTFSALDAAMTSCAPNDVLYIVIIRVGSTSPGTGLYMKVAF